MESKIDNLLVVEDQAKAIEIIENVILTTQHMGHVENAVKALGRLWLHFSKASQDKIKEFLCRRDIRRRSRKVAQSRLLFNGIITRRRDYSLC